MDDEKDYVDLVARQCEGAVQEFAAAIGRTEMQRRAICRYLKRGRAVGISTGELVDFLAISSSSILERAGYSDSESQSVMKLLGEVSDGEIEGEEA